MDVARSLWVRKKSRKENEKTQVKNAEKCFAYIFVGVVVITIPPLAFETCPKSIVIPPGRCYQSRYLHSPRQFKVLLVAGSIEVKQRIVPKILPSARLY